VVDRSIGVDADEVGRLAGGEAHEVVQDRDIRLVCWQEAVYAIARGVAAGPQTLDGPDP
jgi:hypothetical protein